ncbi:MAG: tetratricopeptide repeat protein [Acidobacteriota bacterium]
MADRLYARAALSAGLVGIVAILWLGPGARSAWHPTDFDRELQRLDAEVSALRSPGLETPDRVTRLAFRLYHRATLTARSEDFLPVQALVDRALSGWPAPDLLLLRATIDLRFHRLEDARHSVNAIEDAANDDSAQLLLADIALQDRGSAEARRRIDAVLDRRPTWDARSRLAWLLARQGDVDGADQQYAAAEAELTAKEMPAFAWVELQRGQMYFARGQYERAAGHYQRARRAFSGYWLTDEYEAELLGARRDFDRAVARYQDAISRAPRPDLFHQLGDLYLAMGRPIEAGTWHERALAGYLASVDNGEVQFFHHLATFYSDVRQDGAAAVRWAKQDWLLRPNDATEDTLAWALYRNGQFAEALDRSSRALAGDSVDGHLLFHAMTINQKAGRSAEVRGLRARLEAFNPSYGDFHVHR